MPIIIMEGTRPNAYEYGGHPAPAGPALPNLINAVSILKSKSKHTDHRRGVPDSGTHDLHVTTTPDPTTPAAAETADSNVASTRGGADASSPRDDSRRRGRARDARRLIMRAATIRPVGVMFDLLVDMLDVSVVITRNFYIDIVDIVVQLYAYEYGGHPAQCR